MLLFILSLLFQAAPALTEAPQAPSAALDPDPDRVVEVSVFIIDISEIDEREQSVTVDLGLRATWREPSLADPNAPASRTFSIDAVESPNLIIYNSRDLDRKMTEEVHVDREGNARYRQRYQGTLSAPLELNEFPFDSQTIQIKALPLDHNGRTIVPKWENIGSIQETSLPGWQVDKPTTTLETLASIDGTREFPVVVTSYLATRYQSFFFWKLFVPLTLIVFMAYAIFWLDPAVLPTQIAVSTSSVFALIAYNFALGHMLPKTSYLTRADLFIIGCTILVFSAMYMSILTGTIARNPDRVALARRIDVYGRYVYVLAYLFVAWLYAAS